MQYHYKGYAPEELQVKRNLPPNCRKAFSEIISEIKIRYNYLNNLITVTKNNLIQWGVKNRPVLKAVRKELENAGFWVKIKRSQYMINPALLNGLPPNQVGRLFSIYKKRGGIDIVIDKYVKNIESPTMARKSNLEVEKELENEYLNLLNLATSKALREKDETNMRLEKKIDDQGHMINDQGHMITDLKGDIKQILALLTKDQIKKIPAHVKLIAENGELV